MSLLYQEYGLSLMSTHHALPEAPMFVGLECEIEGIRAHNRAEAIGFHVTNDGSLRNNGYEYISQPLIPETAIAAFRALHGTIDCRPDIKFSNRTSIHVHANCMNLESATIRNIVLWYALYEELFFLMCDPDRRNNIHCVALTETYLPSLYHHTLGNLVSRWHKYTALNLKPLAKYGTIEFRHMQGHDDPELLRQWLSAITGLFDLGKSVKITQDTFTEDLLHMGFDQIFGKTNLAGSWALAQTLISNSIIDVKLGL